MVLGATVPLLMFLSWDAAVLGSSSVGGGDSTVAIAAAGAASASSSVVVDPLEALRQSGPLVGGLVDSFTFLAIGEEFGVCNQRTYLPSPVVGGRGHCPWGSGSGSRGYICGGQAVP